MRFFLVVRLPGLSDAHEGVGGSASRMRAPSNRACAPLGRACAVLVAAVRWALVGGSGEVEEEDKEK
jgi:hypothetical protein